MAEGAAAIAEEYFDRVRARDLGVVDLFHDAATIVGLGGEKQGKDAIRSFYQAQIEGAQPSPRIIGEIFSSESRAAAEVEISLANGSTLHVMDLFVVEEGLIRSLTYFLADH